METTMNDKRTEMLRMAAERGKYSPLYRHLQNLHDLEWLATFAQIEKVLGFELPDSAHIHRPWWANTGKKGGHSQSLAWNMAGWKTKDVDQAGQTVVFVRSADASA